MDNLLTRHRNLSVLAVVLFVQVVGLAVQVKRPTEGGSARLIRVWTVSTLTPLEKGVVYTQNWFRDIWRDYFALRKVREENQALRDENQRLRIEAVRLAEDASQARRLQALFAFKEQFIQKTLAAQVISTTGSEFSRGLYLDKGSRDGVKVDMPVITPDGVVGKVFRVYPSSSLVLEINDPSSGAGVILDKSRLQGILKGNAAGETIVHNIMRDENVQVGERVVTSGGDRIFPKGMPVGIVSSVSPGPDLFFTVRVKPTANLNRLEEVLVITQVLEKTPDTPDTTPRQRAADILAERLPQVPSKPPEATPGGKPAPGGATNPAPGVKPPANTPPGEGNTPGTTPPPVKPAPSATNAASATTAAPRPKPDTAKPATPPLRDPQRQ